VAAGGGRSPFQITLRAGERRFLKARARQTTAPYRQVVRARIVLLAAAGLANARIARKLGIAPNTAGKWRKRFWEGGHRRAGRPQAAGPPAGVRRGGGGPGQGDRV
jgi:transposase-like protein